MLKKNRDFCGYDFFRFYGPGDHNSGPILQKSVSFCQEDQMPSIDTNFSPVKTLTLE